MYVSSSTSHLYDDVVSVRPSVFCIQLALASFLVASVTRRGRHGHVHVRFEETNVADVRQNDVETKDGSTRLGLPKHTKVKLEFTSKIEGTKREGAKVYGRFIGRAGVEVYDGVYGGVFRRGLPNGRDGRTTRDEPEVVTQLLL